MLLDQVLIAGERVRRRASGGCERVGVGGVVGGHDGSESGAPPLASTHPTLPWQTTLPRLASASVGWRGRDGPALDAQPILAGQTDWRQCRSFTDSAAGVDLCSTARAASGIGVDVGAEQCCVAVLQVRDPEGRDVLGKLNARACRWRL
jgi:hypothetical protein